MLTLVTGGAASGKSEYAERLLDGFEGEKIYLATMTPGSAEAKTRIARHRAARAGRGFTTVERATCIAQLSPKKNSAILLECLTNLAANELFEPDGAGKNAEREILRGIELLDSSCVEMVVVSGEVFSDGCDYDAGTREYIELLGRLNIALASRAGRVVEVVCSIPLIQKWEGETQWDRP